MSKDTTSGLQEATVNCNRPSATASIAADQYQQQYQQKTNPCSSITQADGQHHFDSKVSEKSGDPNAYTSRTGSELQDTKTAVSHEGEMGRVEDEDEEVGIHDPFQMPASSCCNFSASYSRSEGQEPGRSKLGKEALDIQSQSTQVYDHVQKSPAASQRHHRHHHRQGPHSRRHPQQQPGVIAGHEEEEANMINVSM